MRPVTLSHAVALAVLAALPAAAEDLTIVQKQTHDTGPPVTMTSYISSDKLRMLTGEGNEVLAEPGAGKFTMIDNNKKQYYVVTKQDLEAMAAQMKQMGQQMQQAQEQLKNLPPEAREKMAGLMGGMGAAIDVQKVAGGRTIAGYRCENWTISMGQVSRTEQCLSTDLQLPAQLWDAYRDFSESLKSAMGGAMGQTFDQMKEKFKDMKGFPMAATTTTKVMGRTSINATEVTEVKKGPIPATAWQIPAGYRQVEAPMAKLGKKK